MRAQALLVETLSESSASRRKYQITYRDPKRGGLWVGYLYAENLRMAWLRAHRDGHSPACIIAVGGGSDADHY
ncbi:MAG TPA: hypothetical protein VNN09_05945 [Candidatus Competibacteraceae bacterium]|nr:hypothetical protein [Candidatus Competibacteraceae bacterium]